jgi:hypothetical protein
MHSFEKLRHWLFVLSISLSALGLIWLTIPVLLFYLYDIAPGMAQVLDSVLRKADCLGSNSPWLLCLGGFFVACILRLLSVLGSA